MRCKLDRRDARKCSRREKLPHLGEGVHTLRVSARTATGRISYDVSRFRYDTTPAEIDVEQPLADEVFGPNATAVFSANERVVFFCKVDNEPGAQCTSPVSSSSLSHGRHVLRVTARDRAGNMSSVDTPFSVDRQAPVVTIGSPVAGSTQTATSTVVGFTVNEPAETTCKLDNGPVEDCVTLKPYLGLSLGTHTITVTATDEVGNVSSSAVSFTVTTSTPPPPPPPDDTTSPVVTITSPAVGHSTTSTSVSVGFTVNESATTTCRLDGGSAASCTSPRNYSGLNVGSHTVVVTATDTAGNVGSRSITFSVTAPPPPPPPVDTTPPVITISSPAAGSSSSSTGASVVFSVNETATTTCALDGATAASCTSPRSYTGLSVGSHTVVVTATDTAGNVGSASRSFTVTSPPPPPPPDTTPPVVTISSPAAGSSSTSTSASVAFTVNETATTTCALDGSTATSCTSPRNYTGLGVGSHTVVVTATDTAGNVGSASRSFSVTAPPPPPPDTTAPVVTISSPAAGSSSTSTSASVVFSVNETATTTCALDGATAASCTSPRSYTGLGVGSHTVVVTATDTAGNVGSASRSFSVTEPPPPGTSSLDATATDHSRMQLTWQAPAGSSTVEIVRRDLVDTAFPDVVVSTVPSSLGAFTDVMLWYNNSYRYTATFKNASGGTVGTLTDTASTNSVSAATYPVAFAGSSHITTRLSSSTPMAPTDVSNRYANYIATHTNSANMTLRSYAIPVYEARPSDPLIGPFSCGYNCQLPRTGPASIPLPVKPKPVGILGLGLLSDPGSDHHMSVISADRNTHWDFYRPDEDNTDLDKTNPEVWKFMQAGATFSPNTANPAIAAPSNYAAANAANFSNIAGLIRPEEIALGEIRHALMLGVPGIGSATGSGNVPACPATHNALVNDPNTGGKNPDSPPEGLRYRLNPNFDVNTLSKPWERIVAKAMQEYGAYVRDNSGKLGVYAEGTSLNTVTGDTRGGRGYDGWTKTKMGFPVNSGSTGFSANFPWNQLQVVAFTPGPNCG